MSSYELFGFIPLLGILVIALFMVISPAKCTKKELRDSEDMVKKTRRRGIFLLIIALIVMIIYIVMQIMQSNYNSHSYIKYIK